jgi:pyruvate,water dikinase
MTVILDGKITQSFSSEIGGKAKGLLFLNKNKFLTPPFFILDFETLSSVTLGNVSLENIVQNWVLNHNINSDDIWAVRSSADVEDGSEHSYAGIFSTVINVKTTALENAIQKVLSSYSSINNQNYSLQQHTEFGIIIQKMIRSEYSGVIFSHNPNNINDETIHINIIPGIGENLVSGKEEAYSVTYSKGKYSYLNSENTFYGQFFSDTLHPIEKKGENIKKETDQYLSSLVKGTKDLCLLKNQPIDIEFTIADGNIYWLQIRPITTGKNESIIWDNTASEGNYPGITLPLSISVTANSMYRVYKNMAIFLGMPKNQLLNNEYLLKNMSGGINGALYYNVTAWQKLIYQLPFGKKASKALPKMWGMKDAIFNPEKHSTNKFSKAKLFLKLLVSFLFFKKLKKKYIENFNKVHNYYEKIDFKHKNHDELISSYSSIEKDLGGNWEAPMLNGFFTIVIFSSLKKCVHHSRLHSKYPNFINDILFSQGDVISVLILNEFQNLIDQIENNLLLNKLFKESEPQEIFKVLKTEHTDFYNKITNYILKYGDRCEEGELKIETINYKEDPISFILILKKCTNNEVNRKRQKIIFDYKAILKKEYKFNILKRIVLGLLVRQTIDRIRDRENFKFMRTNSFNLIRKVFREIDANLLTMKVIEYKSDSLYLKLDEILNTTITNDYKNIISKRKEDYMNYKSMERVNRYIQFGQDFKPDLSCDIPLNRLIVSGTGCCSGIVKGEVKIIDDGIKETENYFGKILVANYFEPGKLGLLSQASGLISVRGNLLSHTSIVCREMGIPSIIGAKGLLSKVKNGDLIEMNGGTGTIKLLLEHE